MDNIKFFRWYEELKAKYEFEKSKLLENKDALQKDITKLNEKISIISSEKQDLENKVKQTEKQVKYVIAIIFLLNLVFQIVKKYILGTVDHIY